MVRHIPGLSAAAVLLAALPLWAGPPADAVPLEPQALAERIDAALAKRWQAAGVTPAPQVDDATYLRRVHLDVAGKTAPVSDVRRFLDDPSPDKRERLVEQLLDGPAYVTHFTDVWRTAWMPEAENNFTVRFVTLSFETWLRQKLAENTPYDQVVREMLTTPVAQGRNGPFENARKPGPYGFFYGKDMKPENLSSATTRLFLGIRLECAQ